jgi:hypothetical protein
MENQACAFCSLFLYPFVPIALPERNGSSRVMVLSSIFSVLQALQKADKGTSPY